MDPITPSQQESWQNNIYVLSTKIVLLALLLILLLRSAYQFYQRMRTGGGNAGASGKFHGFVSFP